MKLSEKASTGVILVSTLCWLAIAIFGVLGKGQIGMYFTVILSCCYPILGTRAAGEVDNKLLFYPIVLWAIAQFICIIGMNYYEALFRGVKPSFTILGMHPSYAFVAIFFWLLSVATWSVGIYVMRKNWLSQERWDSFLKKINDLNAKEGK